MCRHRLRVVAAAGLAGVSLLVSACGIVNPNNAAEEDRTVLTVPKHRRDASVAPPVTLEVPTPQADAATSGATEDTLIPVITVPTTAPLPTTAPPPTTAAPSTTAPQPTTTVSPTPSPPTTAPRNRPDDPPVCDVLNPFGLIVVTMIASDNIGSARSRLASFIADWPGIPTDATNSTLLASMTDLLTAWMDTTAGANSLVEFRSILMKTAVTHAQVVVDFINATSGCGAAVNQTAQMRQVANALLAQAALPTTGPPVGGIDGISVDPGGGVLIWGWGTDPDANGPIDVRVIVDGRSNSIGPTKETGPFPEPVLPGYLHGFFGWNTTLTRGTHRLCVTLVNVGPGADASVGCKTATIG